MAKIMEQTPKGWQGGRTVGAMVRKKSKVTSGSEKGKNVNKNARIPDKKTRLPYGKYRPDGAKIDSTGRWWIED